MLRTTIRRLTIVAAAIGAAGPALAEPGASVAVNYQDLNLASPAGAAALKLRVGRAVEAVCPASDLRDLAQLARVSACRKEATRVAGEQVATAIDTAQRLAARATAPMLMASR